jgi:hypothetical protein
VTVALVSVARLEHGEGDPVAGVLRDSGAGLEIRVSTPLTSHSALR